MKFARMTIDDLKTLYKQMALIHHPDKGGEAEVFKQIKETIDKLIAFKQIGMGHLFNQKLFDITTNTTNMPLLQNYAQTAHYIALGLITLPFAIKYAWKAIRLLNDFVKSRRITIPANNSKNNTNQHLSAREKTELIDALHTVDDPNIKIALASNVGVP